MRNLIRRDPLAAAAVMITICALVAAALASPRELRSGRPVGPTAAGPSAELVRCRALGEAGGGDAACHAAWAESRRRFFAGGRHD